MKKIIQILSIALMLAEVSASAQVTSTISTGNWNTAGNWSNGVPGDGATSTVTVESCAVLFIDGDMD